MNQFMVLLSYFIQSKAVSILYTMKVLYLIYGVFVILL